MRENKRKSRKVERERNFVELNLVIFNLYEAVAITSTDIKYNHD